MAAVLRQQVCSERCFAKELQGQKRISGDAVAQGCSRQSVRSERYLMAAIQPVRSERHLAGGTSAGVPGGALGGCTPTSKGNTRGSDGPPREKALAREPVSE